MDKYTMTEEAYKKGREDAIKKISEKLVWEFECLSCPARNVCKTEDGCGYGIADWMRGLFEEET